jgi:Putative transposase of IS4/5 family (DUF4096)
MTPADDDVTILRHILARTTALLLDFDGPVCSVFAGLSAHTVVTQLCTVLADGGYGDPPTEIEKSDDPFEVLTYAANLGDDEARYVNAAFTAHELEAIAIAEPTPTAHDLIRVWSATGRPLPIVSNNSTIAIHAYLDLHDLRTHVTLDVTDAEWELLGTQAQAVMVELRRGPGGRPMDHDLRAVLDAVRYVTRYGIEWRALPVDFLAGGVCLLRAVEHPRSSAGAGRPAPGAAAGGPRPR